MPIESLRFYIFFVFCVRFDKQVEDKCGGDSRDVPFLHDALTSERHVHAACERKWREGESEGREVLRKRERKRGVEGGRETLTIFYITPSIGLPLGREIVEG